jgi:hypothetical protein
MPGLRSVRHLCKLLCRLPILPGYFCCGDASSRPYNKPSDSILPSFWISSAISCHGDPAIPRRSSAANISNLSRRNDSHKRRTNSKLCVRQSTGCSTPAIRHPAVSTVSAVSAISPATASPDAGISSCLSESRNSAHSIYSARPVLSRSARYSAISSNCSAVPASPAASAVITIAGSITSSVTSFSHYHRTTSSISVSNTFECARTCAYPACQLERIRT